MKRRLVTGVALVFCHHGQRHRVHIRDYAGAGCVCESTGDRWRNSDPLSGRAIDSRSLFGGMWSRMIHMLLRQTPPNK
jgi:hypothetical protein